MNKVILALLLGLGIVVSTHAEEATVTVAGVNSPAYTPSPVTQSEGLTNWFNEASAGKGPIAMPGYMWGFGGTPGSMAAGAPTNNIGYSAKVEQGVDWFAFDEDKKWRFNTFVNAMISKDTSSYAYTYGNVFAPAVGVKIRNVYESGLIEAGVQYVNQHNLTTSSASGQGVQAFVSYWFGWDLKR
jgi:hypothetical protein